MLPCSLQCIGWSEGSASAVAGEVRLAQPPKGATEELKKAFLANNATMIDVLDLRNISINSSHMADADVDPEYVCPICLVRLTHAAHTFLVSELPHG